MKFTIHPQRHAGYVINDYPSRTRFNNHTSWDNVSYPRRKILSYRGKEIGFIRELQIKSDGSLTIEMDKGSR